MVSPEPALDVDSRTSSSARTGRSARALAARRSGHLARREAATAPAQLLTLRRPAPRLVGWCRAKRPTRSSSRVGPRDREAHRGRCLGARPLCAESSSREACVWTSSGSSARRIEREAERSPGPQASTAPRVDSRARACRTLDASAYASRPVRLQRASQRRRSSSRLERRRLAVGPASRSSSAASLAIDVHRSSLTCERCRTCSPGSAHSEQRRSRARARGACRAGR